LTTLRFSSIGVVGAFAHKSLYFYQHHDIIFLIDCATWPWAIRISDGSSTGEGFGVVKWQPSSLIASSPHVKDSDTLALQPTKPICHATLSHYERPPEFHKLNRLRISLALGGYKEYRCCLRKRLKV